MACQRDVTFTAESHQNSLRDPASTQGSRASARSPRLNPRKFDFGRRSYTPPCAQDDIQWFYSAVRVRKNGRSVNRPYCLSFRASLFRVLKFGKAKQIVVTFIATTFKALLSVAKTNVRFSGCKLYAGNIDYFLLNVLAHISPYQHIKKCAPKGTHRKNAFPSIVVTRIAPPTKG